MRDYCRFVIERLNQSRDGLAIAQTRQRAGGICTHAGIAAAKRINKRGRGPIAKPGKRLSSMAR